MERPQRQSLTNNGERPANPNVFDDEYEVDIPDEDLEYRAADSAFTATREAESSRVGARSQTPTRPSARRSISAKEAGERSEQIRVYRSSIAKETRGSFEMMHEGNTGSRTPSTYYAEAAASTRRNSRNRPISAASSYADVDDRPRGSFIGSSGPSHPYDLFPQAGVRSSVVTNSNTPRIRPSIYTPALPSHPYGLYQQNSFPVDESEVQVAPAIQVGFPGRNTNFRRQIGPDGEEQDIIGPDGHTEQLPPYSKYPDEDTVKVPITAPAPVSPVSPVDGPSASRSLPQSQEQLVSPVVPVQAQPLPLQDLTPQASQAVPAETQSRDTLSRSRSSHSSRSSIEDEKEWKDKSWKEKRRTRVCGGRLPLWVLLLGVSLILFFIILIGGIVGGLLAVERKNEDPPTVTVTSTQSMFDASMIPAPTNAPALQAGQYILPLGIPQEQQKSCLTTGDQLNAWSCNVPPNPQLLTEIGSPPSGYNVMKLLAGVQTNTDGSPARYNFTYGAQPPRVAPSNRLYWVTDLGDPQRGPALHFQTTYDKLVILQENEFSTGKKRKQKRLLPPFGGPEYTPYGPHPPGEEPTPPPPHAGSTHHRNQMLGTGDSPWFCYWNQTFIEGFIYIQENSTSGNGKGASPTTGGAAATSSLPKAAMTAAPSVSLGPRALDESDISSLFKRMAAASPSKDYTIPTNGPGGPKKFPYVVKIQERRMPNSGSQPGMAPYCQQMHVPSDGPPYPVTDDDGRPIQVHLTESDPTNQDFSTALNHKTPGSAASSTASAGHRRLRREIEELREFSKRDDPPKSCHCLWVTPNGP